MDLTLVQNRVFRKYMEWNFDKMITNMTTGFEFLQDDEYFQETSTDIIFRSKYFWKFDQIYKRIANNDGCMRWFKNGDVNLFEISLSLAAKEALIDAVLMMYERSTVVDIFMAIAWLKKKCSNYKEAAIAPLSFFGMWIRNRILWSDTALSDWFVRHGIGHPDEMSGIILECLAEDLNESTDRDKILAAVFARSFINQTRDAAPGVLWMLSRRSEIYTTFSGKVVDPDGHSYEIRAGELLLKWSKEKGYIKTEPVQPNDVLKYDVLERSSICEKHSLTESGKAAMDALRLMDR